MGHDELIEALAREHRYRNVLVVAAVVGVLASAAVGIAASLGHEGSSDRLGLFVLPFAASMVVGGGIHKLLLARGRRRESARPSTSTSSAP